MMSELAARGELTYHEISNKAESIYSGLVTNLSSYYSEDGRTIYTDVTLKVKENIKGENKQEISDFSIDIDEISATYCK